MVNRDLLVSLVTYPQESLDVEIKSWVDPNSPDGKALIVKACLAMRNHNGGYVLIGFDDTTLQPILDNVPDDVRAAFHPDEIQAIIAKYSSKPFEVAIHFVERDGQEFPVIEIPSGARSLVATRSAIPGEGKGNRLNENKVFIRTLNANNTPSSSEPTWKDWEDIMEIFFDNREADIARFIRRNFISIDLEKLKGVIPYLVEDLSGATESRAGIELFLEESALRFESIVSELEQPLPVHGSWEAVFAVKGVLKQYTPNPEFLNLISSSNPRYSGWPLWLDSRTLQIKGSRPRVIDNTWEAFIYAKGDISHQKSIDFWRAHTGGMFYHRRSFQDDFSHISSAPTPGTALDFVLPVLRVTEAIGIGQAIAKLMVEELENCEIEYIFRWRGLQDRMLVSWVDSARHLSYGRLAYQNEVKSEVTMPLDAPQSAIFQYVEEAVRPLFEVFDGFELATKIIEELANKVLTRQF
jgi:hypothetical protein